MPRWSPAWIGIRAGKEFGPSTSTCSGLCANRGELVGSRVGRKIWSFSIKVAGLALWTFQLVTIPETGAATPNASSGSAAIWTKVLSAIRTC